MFVFRLAYVYPNGEVEGFKGFAFGSKDAAAFDAVAQVERKCHAIGIPFDHDGIRQNYDSLTVEQRQTVESDWKSALRY